MKKISSGIIIFFFLSQVFLFHTGFPQNKQPAGKNQKLDSLLSIYKNSAEDTNKVIAGNALWKQYLRTSEHREALRFAQETENLCEKLLKANKKELFVFLKRNLGTALNGEGNVYYNHSNYSRSIECYATAQKHYEEIDDKKGIGNSINNIGLMYYMQGNYSRAFDFFSRSLAIRKSINDKPGLATTFNNLGLLFDRQGNYPVSLEYHFKSMSLREELNDKPGLGLSLTNIGVIYSNQNNFEKALEYYNKALKIQAEAGDKRGLGNTYNNIGLIYQNKRNYHEAIGYNNKAMAVRTEIGDEYGIAYTLSNLGSIYFNENKFKEALEEHKKALEIREKIKDSLGIALSLNKIGSCYFNLNDLKNAEDYCSRGYKLSRKVRELTAIEEADMNMSEIFSKTKQFEKAYMYYKDYVRTRDSLLNEDNTKKTVRAEMNYEFEKKQATERLEQEKKDALAEAENHKQKLIIRGGAAILVLVLLFAVLIYRSYLQKQKANVEISKQKQIIEEKQKEIVDSIHYAQRIQTTMLTAESYFASYLKEFFIFYRPKDIVSGDFYWALDHGDKFYLVAADCTGHGVPGAFMSLINIAFLNEIIIEKKITRPDLILNEVRNSLIRAMNTGRNVESKDGMDCILCAFDFKSLTLEYAAANNSLYLARNNELITCRADKMPVGKGERTDPFSYQQLALQKDDMVYLLTDGYADQFGGDKGKKFKYKQLEETLLNVNKLTMEEQKSSLGSVFDRWKGTLEQVDDVLIIGVRV